MDAVCENAGLVGPFYVNVNLDMEVRRSLTAHMPSPNTITLPRAGRQSQRQDIISSIHSKGLQSIASPTSALSSSIIESQGTLSLGSKHASISVAN